MGINPGKETNPMPKKKIVKKGKILEEIKRHNKVLMEHMEKQVKTVAEQHSSVIEKLEEHDENFKRIDQRFGRIEEVAMENRKDVRGLQTGQERIEELAMENRKDIRGLQTGQKRLEAGQEEIKQKLDTVVENHEKRIQKLEAVR